MFPKPISASPAGKSHTINSSYQIRFFRIVEKIQFEGGIFITEKDYYQAGKAVYMIQNMNQTLNQPFGDGAHILYVNGEYRDDSAIGKLMHDFNCADADDMHYGLLAERTRYLKENSKGVNEMYRTMDEVEKECYEEGREKGRETQAELTAINLRKLGLPLEQIAHAVGFHVEKVEKWVK